MIKIAEARIKLRMAYLTNASWMMGTPEEHCW